MGARPVGAGRFLLAAAELAPGLAERAGELGELVGTEHQKHHDQHDDQSRWPEVDRPDGTEPPMRVRDARDPDLANVARRRLDIVPTGGLIVARVAPGNSEKIACCQTGVLVV
jgi:hypothetical protein